MSDGKTKRCRRLQSLALGDRESRASRASCMAVIVIAGVFGLFSIGQKEDPDFTFRVMIVQAIWPGASLQDMQDQVVNKIERKLQETPHLDYVKSFTRAGSAVIQVNIKGDTNAARGRRRLLSGAQEDRRHRQRTAVGPARPLFQRRVRRHLRHAARDLPATAIQLSGVEDLRQGARATSCCACKGVEKVSILGDQDQKIHIDVSSKALAEHGLSPARHLAGDRRPEQCRRRRQRRDRDPLGARLGRRRSALGGRRRRSSASRRARR